MLLFSERNGSSLVIKTSMTYNTANIWLFNINNIVLVFSLLTLNKFHTFFYCFYCWLWASKYKLKNHWHQYYLCLLGDCKLNWLRNRRQSWKQQAKLWTCYTQNAQRQKSMRSVLSGYCFSWVVTYRNKSLINK